MECSGCGKDISQDDAFCRACGAATGNLAEGGGEAVAPEPAVTPLPEPPGAPVPAPRQGAKAPPPPPPMPTAAVSTTEQGTRTPPPPAPPAQAPQPPATGPRPRTSGWAIASLVMGILGLTCLFFVGSILAIIFGAVARHEIKKSGGTVKGGGLAAAGLTLGIIVVAVVVIGSAVFFPLTLLRVGPTRTITRTVDRAGATSVNARLDMRLGNMNVGGGAAELMRGQFTYNVADWRPEVAYDVTGGKGDLLVKQPDKWDFVFWNIRNDWDIHLNDSVPLDLSTTLRGGEGRYDLSSLEVTSFSADSTAGNVTVDLSGDMRSLKTVTTELSAGNTNLDLSGTYSLPVKLDASSKAGNIDVNLVGNWKADLDAVINNSAGNIVLELPSDVGVIVTAKVSFGNVQASGLNRGPRDDTFVNDQYGKSPITLNIDAKNSAGNIRLTVSR